MAEHEKESTAQHRWAWGMAIVTGVGGTVVLVAEIAYTLVHAFGLHGEHGCEELWGAWQAVALCTVLYLASAAYSSGTPTRTGQDMLRALARRFGAGEEEDPHR